MIRVVLVWAAVLALSAFALQQLQYAYFARAVPQDVYIAIVALAFAAGGVWAGLRLKPAGAPARFERNKAAIASLGLTGQEVRVLERIAAGQSTKEIARTLGLSPNTVKTHLANLFAKLEVNRRTQAIGKARELSLIP
jgi:DNA-binding CsgD family transcriptional regulator